MFIVLYVCTTYNIISKQAILTRLALKRLETVETLNIEKKRHEKTVLQLNILICCSNPTDHVE